MLRTVKIQTMEENENLRKDKTVLFYLESLLKISPDISRV